MRSVDLRKVGRFRVRLASEARHRQLGRYCQRAKPRPRSGQIGLTSRPMGKATATHATVTRGDHLSTRRSTRGPGSPPAAAPVASPGGLRQCTCGKVTNEATADANVRAGFMLKPDSGDSNNTNAKIRTPRSRVLQNRAGLPARRAMQPGPSRLVRTSRLCRGSRGCPQPWPPPRSCTRPAWSCRSTSYPCSDRPSSFC